MDRLSEAERWLAQALRDLEASKKVREAASMNGPASKHSKRPRRRSRPYSTA